MTSTVSTHSRVRNLARLSFLAIVFATMFVSIEDSFGQALPTPTPSPFGTDKAEGFGNESEVGLVISSGNAPAQSLNLLQKNSYGWVDNLFKSQLRYYWAEARSVESARYWLAGLRYERSLSEIFSAFVAETVESDRFADYDPRYSTDIGLKYWIKKEEKFHWAVESGYRYSLEKRINSEDFERNIVRLYMEAMYTFSESDSAKLWVEYLPDVPSPSNYLLNTEASVSAALNEVFALKTSWLIKYNNRPANETIARTDSLLTTALVAKF